MIFHYRIIVIHHAKCVHDYNWLIVHNCDIVTAWIKNNQASINEM